MFEPNPTVESFKKIYTPKLLAAALSLAMGEKRITREQIKTLEKFAEESVGMPLPTSEELYPQYNFGGYLDKNAAELQEVAKAKKEVITNFASASASNFIDRRDGTKNNAKLRDTRAIKHYEEKYLKGLMTILPMLAGQEGYFHQLAQNCGDGTVNGANVLKEFMTHVEESKNDEEAKRQNANILTDEEMLKMAGLTATDVDYTREPVLRQKIDDLIQRMREGGTINSKTEISEATFRAALAKLDAENQWSPQRKLLTGAGLVAGASIISLAGVATLSKERSSVPEKTTPAVRTIEEEAEGQQGAQPTPTDVEVEKQQNWTRKAVDEAVKKAKIEVEAAKMRH